MKTNILIVRQYVDYEVRKCSLHMQLKQKQQVCYTLAGHNIASSNQIRVSAIVVCPHCMSATRLGNAHVQGHSGG